MVIPHSKALGQVHYQNSALPLTAALGRCLILVTPRSVGLTPTTKKISMPKDPAKESFASWF